MSDRDALGLRSFIEDCKSFGFTIAYDDVNGNHSGMHRLKDFQPDLVKLDTTLVQGIFSENEDKLDQALLSFVDAIVAAISFRPTRGLITP